MVRPWADQPFALIPTSKVAKPTASIDAIFVADSMTNAHNMLIRCLNSIYLQGPFVKEEADICDLLQYSLFWIEWVNDHHAGEEAVFFPEIERVTGEQGIMHTNIEQHHAFHPGIEGWSKYCSNCLNKEEEQRFEATEFRRLMDVFARPFVSHLAEEIPTLLALDKYDIEGVKRAWNLFDKHVFKTANVYTRYPIGMGSVDWTYEGGNNFPAIPFFVPYLVNWWYGGRHKSVWRFNPNTLLGKKRPLLFLPKDEE